MNVDKVVMKEKIEATIDLLTQLLADFTEEAPVAEEKPAKKAATTTKGKKATPVQEEEPEEKPAKGKKKAAPEPEEEEEEDELTLEDLKEMDLAELKELATSQELEMPKKVTKASLLKAFEEQFFSEEEEEEAPAEEPVEEKPAKKSGKKKAEPEPEPEQEEEEEEELTAEDINEMSLEELKGIVKDYELEIPAATLKNVKKLRAAIIEIIEAPEEEEEDAAEESFEASSERLEAEADIEKEIRQLLKNKKLTTAKMKKFLANYYEGNADCEDCSNCSTEELTACYIQTKQALVDDEGEVHEEAEAYTRNGEYYCCGVPLQEDNSCAICGSEYAEDEE